MRPLLCLIVAACAACASPAPPARPTPWLEEIVARAPRLRVLSLSLGDRRGWRPAIADEVRRVFARRVDVDALPWWTNVTVWIEDGELIAAEVPTSAITGRKVLAASVVVGGVRQWFDDEGRSMDGPFLARPLSPDHDEAFVSSRVGMRVHPVLGRWKFHHGTDYAARTGTPVVAVGPGVVKRIARDKRRGLYVTVAHDNGMETRHLHLSKVEKRVLKHRRVQTGDVLGYVGESGMATGPHLHFELRMRRRALDPIGLEWPAGPSIAPSSWADLQRRLEQLRALRDAKIATSTTGTMPAAG